MSLKFKKYLITTAALLTALVPAMAITSLAAADCDSGIASTVATGANEAAGNGSNGSAIGCGSTSVSDSSIGALAHNIVNIFSIVVGAVAVLMVIYGGLRYITSGGDSGRVGNAKNTLIYAIIGLLIVALAQLIVHFVLNQSNNISNGSTIIVNTREL
jgi:hypothetical protein